MKIFIIGESHSLGRAQREKIKNLPYFESVVVGIEAANYSLTRRPFSQFIYPSVFGLEDPFVEFYCDIASAYFAFIDTLQGTDAITTKISVAKQIMCNINAEMQQMIDAHEPIYGVDSVTEFLRLLGTFISILENNAKKTDDVVKSDLLALFIQVEAIIQKNKNMPLNGFSLSSFVTEYNITLPEAERQEKIDYFLYFLRDKAFSKNITDSIEYLFKFNSLPLSMILIFGRNHLRGIYKELGDKVHGVEISYCIDYEHFNREYKTYKKHILKIQSEDSISKCLELQEEKISLVKFFNSKIVKPPTKDATNGTTTITAEFTDGELQAIKDQLPHCDIQ